MAKTHTWYPILPIEQIEIGSTWFSADGSGHKVKIIDIDKSSPANWITYEWVEKGQRKTHEKSAFAFQCRYYLPSAGVTQEIDHTDEIL